MSEPPLEAQASDHSLSEKRKTLTHMSFLPVILLLTFIVLGFFCVTFLSKLQHQLVEQGALRSAELYVQALKEFRTLYTSNVVNVVQRQGINITHNIEADKAAIPLPATMSMLLGNKIGENTAGAKTMLYSPYPFPWREDTGGLNEAFRTRAWDYLQKFEKKFYYEFTESGERETLRYAIADRMRSDCIECHNTHPQTPKAGWDVGDLRGVLEVNIVLDDLVLESKDNLQGISIILAVTFGSVFVGIMMVFKRLQSLNKGLENRVIERTQKLQEEIYDRKKAESSAKSLAQSLEHKVQELDEKREQLVQSAKLASIGELTAGLAHEINQPLGVIQLSAERLEREVESVSASEDSVAELKKRIAKILKQVSRAAVIVKQLKVFSRQDIGSEFQENRVNELVEEALSLFGQTLKDSRAQISLEFADDLPKVLCNRIRIEQVITNLLTNAIDAIKNSSIKNIIIRTYLSDSYINIEVEDTGCGIEQATQAKIFDPFYTTKPVGEGTGLGLSVSFGIVNEHSGKLVVTSTINQGSTFTLSLPLTQPDQN